MGLLDRAMKSSGSKKFLIDGFPRNFDNLLVWYDIMGKTCSIIFVLNMDLNEEDMMIRLLERAKSSGRSDDNEETIKKRFKTFYIDTMPVLNIYSLAGKLRTISSLPSPKIVYRQVSELFDSLAILPPYQRTFALIKPDGVNKGNVPQILQLIADRNLTIIKMKVIKISIEALTECYRNMTSDVRDSMTSGAAVALILEGTGISHIYDILFLFMHLLYHTRYV